MRGGLVFGSAAAAALTARALSSWRGRPMENAGELAMVFLAMGVFAGLLVAAQSKERSRRLEQERRAERDKVIEALDALASACETLRSLVCGADR